MQSVDSTLPERSARRDGSEQANAARRPDLASWRMAHELGQTVAAIESPREALGLALKKLCAFAGCSLGHFIVWRSADEPRTEFDQGWYASGEEALSMLRQRWAQSKHPADALADYVLASKLPAWIDQSSPGDAQANELLKDLGVGRALAFPVLVEDRLFAVLEVLFLADRTISREMFDTLCCLTVQLGMALDRQRTAGQLATARTELLEATRRASTAEITNCVLHNVGNVLNSVNVATLTISEKLGQLGIQDLKRVAEMVQQHQDDLAQFIAADERGRHLPRYLGELSNRMESDRLAMLVEVTGLSKNIDHIKDIVTLQQSYSGISGMEETAQLSELLDDAIQINFAALSRHGIAVDRQYGSLPPVFIAKQKLLQIMVNLISNAKYSLLERGSPGGRIQVRLRQAGDRAVIEVEDNGVGIPAENLTRIFAHGFTTRKDGHGFGLHSAAELSRELQGTLAAYSDGDRRGARFVLDIPIKPAGVKQCQTAIL